MHQTNHSISYNTIHANTVKYMAKYVEEFELIKKKQRTKYKFAREFFKDRQICFQNFYKFYNRFIAANRQLDALLPIRRGPKSMYLTMPQIMHNSTELSPIESQVLQYRNLGHNKFIIAEAIRRNQTLNLDSDKNHGKKPYSASTIYRIFVKYGVSRLNRVQKEEKRKIVRDFVGSLLHVDCHYLLKGLIKDSPTKRYFVLGVMDDHSRISWTEVMESTKAIDVTFAMMDALLAIHQQYGIKTEEVLTDNGSEFCGGKTTMNNHPYERLLKHFGIKHLRTKPYRPQTNGKIERYWRAFEEEVIDGAEFASLDALKDAVLGYNFYYNEHRPHQGINGKIPISMLDIKSIARTKETKETRTKENEKRKKEC